MDWFSHQLARHPELGVYLALALGFLIGAVRVRSFSVGGVVGSLLAGLLVGGLFEVPVPMAAKGMMFVLFLFGVGYEVGPRFLPAIKGDGWRFGVLGMFMPTVGLLTAWLVARHLELDPGLAGGLVAGALTQSAALGTASDAIQSLPVAAAAKQTLLAHVGVAAALCYLFGALGMIVFCTVLGPRLLRIDLRREALAVEAQFGITRQRAGVSLAWQPFETRAYRIGVDAPAVGMAVRAAERLAGEARLFVQRIRRGDTLLDADPAEVLQAGDVVAVSGRREVLVGLVGERAEEVDDRSLLQIAVAVRDVYLSRPRWAGSTLAEVAASDSVRGVFLRRLLRDGQEMPIGPGTRIERGDVLQLVGSEAAIAGAAGELGDVIPVGEGASLAAVGWAVLAGALLGTAASLPVGTVTLTIGPAVGVLLAGIATGYLRSVQPLWVRLPGEAVKVLQGFGLSAFAAMVGLGAGPHFLDSLRASSGGLLLGGAVVTLTPLLAGLWFGRHVLRIQPLLLLGALTGAQTSTTALAALQEKSNSSIAVIGYSGAVPVAHVFLTTWGTVIVLLTS